MTCSCEVGPGSIKQNGLQRVLVKVHDNHFSPPSALTIESPDPKAVIADQEPSQEVH
jgi:hypothetical protein